MSCTALVSEWETWVYGLSAGVMGRCPPSSKSPVEPVSAFPFLSFSATLFPLDFPFAVEETLTCQAGGLIACVPLTHACHLFQNNALCWTLTPKLDSHSAASFILVFTTKTLGG